MPGRASCLDSAPRVPRPASLPGSLSKDFDGKSLNACVKHIQAYLSVYCLQGIDSSAGSRHRWCCQLIQCCSSPTPQAACQTIGWKKGPGTGSGLKPPSCSKADVGGKCVRSSPQANHATPWASIVHEACSSDRIYAPYRMQHTSMQPRQSPAGK